jgi:hypothetical protein
MTADVKRGFPTHPAQFSMRNAQVIGAQDGLSASFVQIPAAKASLLRGLTLNRHLSTFGCHQAEATDPAYPGYLSGYLLDAPRVDCCSG